jgi:hypothetical protein
MTVVENVKGPGAAFLGLFDAPAMTLGSDFVFRQNDSLTTTE